VSRRANPQEEDFGEILRNGLNSTRSYVALKQKSRSPVFLQFRPFLHRLTNSVLYIGGKLSAFPDVSHEKWNALDSAETRRDVLANAWKKLPQDRADESRIGSNAGFLVAAGGKDGAAFAKKFSSTHLIHALLEGIEEALKVEIDNKDEVKGYLSYYYTKHLAHAFNSEFNGVKLKDRQVGKRTELLLGQIYVSGGDALLKFQQAFELDGVTEAEDDADAA
jgi:hypothetical protein